MLKLKRYLGWAQGNPTNCMYKTMAVEIEQEWISQDLDSRSNNIVTWVGL